MKSETEKRKATWGTEFDEGFLVETTAGLIGFVQCTRCGAVVTADPGSWRHKTWHDRNSETNPFQTYK